MQIRRLGWAGLELESDGHVALVDLLQDTDWIAGFVGEPRTELPGPPSPPTWPSSPTCTPTTPTPPRWRGR